MLTAFIRAFRTPDLRKKLLFTLGIIALFRFGSSLPAPGISEKNVSYCSNLASKSGAANVYAIVDLLSGNALKYMSVFALGIMPYITASIILQLLTVVIPRLETLKNEGQAGQAKITQYTRYLTIGLAVLQSTGYIELARSGTLFQSSACTSTLNPIIPDASPFRIATMVITMVAGTAVIMWMGELITDRGVGNGMSVMIFTQVIAVIPGELLTIYQTRQAFIALLSVVVVIVVVTGIVFMEQAQRRIPVQYAKRMVGRRMYGGTSTYIPMKVNQAGVIPVIFASSLLYIPQLAVSLFGSSNRPQGWVSFTQRYLEIGTSNSLSTMWVYMVGLLPADRRVHLLLRVDHVQPDRGRRQHEEVRRLHPRHQTGAADRRVPRIRAQPAHHPWVDVPGHRRPLPAGSARRDRRGQPVPVQRREPAHHGRRWPGHGQADREPAAAA